jgi:hypothetical protein
MSSDVGMLAQELKECIPDAVVETGDLNLKNGETIKNFLHVDKSRVYMECVGAVIELGKKTENLDGRIEKLEQQPKNLVIDSIDDVGSLNSKNNNINEIINNDSNKNDVETSSIELSIKQIKIKKNKNNNNNNKTSSSSSICFMNPFKNYKKTLSNNDGDKKTFLKCSPRLIKILLGLTIFAIAFGYVCSDSF